MRYVLCALGLLAVVACAACGDGNDQPVVSPTLTNVQAQVFDISCRFSACHTGAASQAGLDLDAPVRMKLLVPSTEDPTRQLVVPGDPDRSFLMDKLLGRNLPAMPMGGQVSSVQMPIGQPLDAARIELVRAWIAAGAKDD